MDAMKILDGIGTRQGWDSESKLSLMCRFVDFLDLMDSAQPVGRQKYPLESLERWLENQAKWENQAGEGE